jgi:hypothetical protein
VRGVDARGRRQALPRGSELGGGRRRHCCRLGCARGALREDALQHGL